MFPLSLTKKRQSRRPPARPCALVGAVGVALQVGVQNIFGDPPPFAKNVAGYPAGLEDPRQRFVFIGFEEKF